LISDARPYSLRQHCNNCESNPWVMWEDGKMATVDVIIPAFNAAKYLPLALESVLSQTFHDWQILLVDDGSTDNTEEVVAPFLERLGSRIQYIKQKKRGISAARNSAIRASTSEFLAPLDADDVWLPCRLAESLKVLIERPQVGLAYGQVTGIDPEGRPRGTFEGNRRHAEGHIAPHIYMRKVELPCATITFRRRCIDEVGIFDETMRATEDRDLWLRIALRYEVAFVPKVLAYYRVSPNSMSADPQRMLQAQLQFIRKHYGAKGCGLLNRQIACARAYKQRAEALKMQNHPRAALLSSLRALALYPLDLDNFRTAGSLLLNWAGDARGD
jgi:glycosyltransferase involved in cell wall biosynthesis